MDANGTRFHLFFGRDDWAKCSAVTDSGEELLIDTAWKSAAQQHAIGLRWNEEQGEVTLEPRLFNFAPNGSAPSVENRRGAARDRFGNWYWIDETSNRIRVLSSGSFETSDFWRLDDRCLCTEGTQEDFQPAAEPAPQPSIKLSGLAVTENHFLVVGTTGPAGLLIFDLYAGGEPRQIFWPAEIAFVPFDMAARPGGGVWILDRVNRSYWALDRNLNVIGADAGGTVLSSDTPDEFQPIDGSSVRQTLGRTFPQSFSLQQSPPALIDPIAIEALPDGTVLILDYDPSQRFSRIYRYRYSERLPDDISTQPMIDLIEEEAQPDFKLIGYDIAFVPAHTDGRRQLSDRLYIVGADGNQTYAFRICLRDEAIVLLPIPEYLPMRLFGGKALVATDIEAYYDFAEDWIPLKQQHRPRYLHQATLLTTALDGRDPDCVWHRLMLDACIPPETSIEVWSRAANSETDLYLTQWQQEPAPYLRANGTEIPFLRWRKPRNGQASATTKSGDGTWELLFQRAHGRYVQLKLVVSGDERSTPRISALRAYYPRFSYLTNYLPAVYREDDQSASFLDRFLANVEGLQTTLEDKIASAQILFDVRSAPADVLDWLASWFDVALDPSWDEPKRRMFISHAMEFFQYRGTIRGLTMALHLALDPCADEAIFTNSASAQTRETIRIIEKYLTRKTPPATLGDPSTPVSAQSVAATSAWSPDQGRATLNQRYSLFIDPSGASSLQYPLMQPTDSAVADKWVQFSQTTLGFVPSIYGQEQTAWQTFLWNRYHTIDKLNLAHQANYTEFAAVTLPSDLPKVEQAQTDWFDFIASPTTLREPQLWQDFLARRYRRAGALKDAYGTNWTSFEVVPLPAEVPRDLAPLSDWFQFETIVLRMQSTAHRFTVLLPVPATLAFDTDEHQRRLDLCRRIVELEKPAHTVFDARFYWDMFRVGEARLQLDTLIDQGSRAPQLLPNLVIGRGFVGESYLATPALEDAKDRDILGRDALGITPN
jgi:phage tail-like protein